MVKELEVELKLKGWSQVLLLLQLYPSRARLVEVCAIAAAHSASALGPSL